MMRLFIFISMCCWWLSSLWAEEQPKSVENHEKTFSVLLERMNQVKRLEGTFQQTQHLDFFDEELLSEGRFDIEIGKKMSWKVLKPTPSLFVHDGQAPESQGGVAKMILSQMSDLIAGRMDRLKTSYDLSLGELDGRLTLIPKSSMVKSLVAKLELKFNPDRPHVDELMFHEPSGDWTRIRFEHVIVHE